MSSSRTFRIVASRVVVRCRVAARPSWRGATPVALPCRGRSALIQTVEALLEASGVRLLGARQGLAPLRDLGEALVARGLREAGIHLRVLVGLAVDRRLEVAVGVADRRAGRGVADLLQEVEVAEGVAGLRLRGVAEETADVRIAFDVGAT